MDKNKHWFFDALLDLIVTTVIIIAISVEIEWLNYVVFIYTALILTVKLLVLSSSQLQMITRRGKTAVPVWVYHTLYGLNVAVLGISCWYLTSAAWLIIWIVSAFSVRNHKVSTGSS